MHGGCKKLNVLRRILDVKRDEVIGEWKKQHIVLLNVLSKTQYFLGDKIENIEFGVACGLMGARRGVYMVLVGNPTKRKHFVDPG